MCMEKIQSNFLVLGRGEGNFALFFDSAMGLGEYLRIFLGKIRFKHKIHFELRNRWLFCTQRKKILKFILAFLSHCEPQSFFPYF